MKWAAMWAGAFLLLAVCLVVLESASEKVNV